MPHIIQLIRYQFQCIVYSDLILDASTFPVNTYALVASTIQIPLGLDSIFSQRILSDSVKICKPCKPCEDPLANSAEHCDSIAEYLQDLTQAEKFLLHTLVICLDMHQRLIAEGEKMFLMS